MGSRRSRRLPPGLQTDLFEGDEPRLPSGAVAPGAQAAPLAARMRPATLDDFVGQEDVVGPGSPLRGMIERDETPSLVLWGPPGAGKTTLAAIIARTTKRRFEPLSAVDSGVADIRRVVSEARERRRISAVETILFIDELHRFSRNQQDAVLPHVEEGAVTVIGATTENPSFHVVAPLLSRARIFVLHPLDADALRTIVTRAIERDERLREQQVSVDEGALSAIVHLAGGDARAALNLLEMAAATVEPSAEGARAITRETVDAAGQHPTLLYDREGDGHYDHISAYIKSVRGSDPDGALYWLARMLEAGEDPLFVARRVVILASEDIGLADPGGAAAGRGGAAGGALPRHAGGAAAARRGDRLPGARAEVEQRLRGLPARRRGRRAHPQRARPTAPAQRRDGAHARPRLRPRLPVRPRLRGPHPALANPPPAPGGGQHLLRTGRTGG